MNEDLNHEGHEGHEGKAHEGKAMGAVAVINLATNPTQGPFFVSCFVSFVSFVVQL
jgi:hypothetical protein